MSHHYSGPIGCEGGQGRAAQRSARRLFLPRPRTASGGFRTGLLLLETQLPLHDFRNLSMCTTFYGGLSYGHRTT
jgi:hypothetical protein